MKGKKYMSVPKFKRKPSGLDYVTRRWFLKVSYSCLSALEKRVRSK